MAERLYLGIDAGSITVKLALADGSGRLLESEYCRHGLAVRQTLAAMLDRLARKLPGVGVIAAITGSASLGLPESCGLPFVQEVIAASRSIRLLAPDVDVAVELGGEDAKILYLSQGMELRMNEACAGGTGAFIDQMASLLHTDAEGLNELAAQASRVHSIASRCGVFAKTDVVSLLNEGVPREELAASVFQAVVEQTISGLACGRPIRGRVAFLGGPLHFLPELRKRFIQTLGLDNHVVFSAGQFMVAFGAALFAEKEGVARHSESGNGVVSLDELAKRVGGCAVSSVSTPQSLPQLFVDEGDYERFVEKHRRDALPRKPLSECSGDVFLGVDCGSTTIKAVLTDAGGNVLANWYCRNEGDPLGKLVPYVADLLEHLPPSASLRACATTGYGAELARAALSGAFSEVETVAHLEAACALEPRVSYLIDIGGQDMKCLKVTDGALADVKLNEACSSGCGAFLETFAQGLGLDMESFVRAALFAPHPVDLGSRCTVFMNSKVKQAQKEGASIGDIAAGLCYAVARNALYKVLRLRGPEELGEHVLVQGGAFLNDALLRVMERLLAHDVRRPDLAGLMGAWGAALLAIRRAGDFPRSTLTAQTLRNLRISTTRVRCGRCSNHCLLTISHFSSGSRLISGNRCERGGRQEIRAGEALPNLYAWKAARVFAGEPLPPEAAPRGPLGLPRALNMYERYPFWFALFTALGFRVELSPPSDKAIYDLGIEFMPSQSVCFPAKLAHGHVAWLIKQGIKHIFYPCLPWERREYPHAANCYNCPVVCGYPEVVRLNTDLLRTTGCTLHTPFLSVEHEDSLTRILAREFHLPAGEVRRAVRKGRAAQDAYRAELQLEGERALREIGRRGLTGIILSGRPYHVDPLVHHGLPELITSLGTAVISEDSVAHLTDVLPEKLRVEDQWAWHSRLYRAAVLACSREDLEMVQLTSFGCGVDAITTDQVAELLHQKGRLHTLIKIDEGPSLGAAAIRLRSLLAAVKDRHDAHRLRPTPALSAPVVFTRPMRETHTILAPQMAPIHFAVLENVFKGEGYHFRLLPRVGQKAVETGLRLVNNDACYPAQLVIGQLIQALRESDEADRTALLLTQTCGPCRATNYPALLRRALEESGYGNVPLLTLRGHGLGSNQPGFTVPHRLLSRMIQGMLYGDLLQRLYFTCLSRECTSGDADSLLAVWEKRLGEMFAAGKTFSLSDESEKIVSYFSRIRLSSKRLPRVGLVGEILMTYHVDANLHVADLIRREGGEPVLPELTDFFLYCLNDPIYRWQTFGGSALDALAGWGKMRWIAYLRGKMNGALQTYGFTRAGSFSALAAAGRQLVSLGNQAGEGWLLAAEMVRLAASGVNGMLCLQPFGCLPNHITGRGVFKALKHLYPNANVMAVDYEPGSSETNLLNRIKLFMSLAHAGLAAGKRE